MIKTNKKIKITKLKMFSIHSPFSLFKADRLLGIFAFIIFPFSNGMPFDVANLFGIFAFIILPLQVFIFIFISTTQNGVVLAQFTACTLNPRVRVCIQSIGSGFCIPSIGLCSGVRKELIGFVSTTSALVLTFVFAFFDLALCIAAATSNDTGEINKSEILEGEVDKSEDLVVEKKKTKTKTHSEDSSETTENDENSEAGYDADDSNNGSIGAESSGHGSETTAETAYTGGHERPSAPNNSPEPDTIAGAESNKSFLRELWEIFTDCC